MWWHFTETNWSNSTIATKNLCLSNDLDHTIIWVHRIHLTQFVEYAFPLPGFFLYVFRVSSILRSLSSNWKWNHLWWVVNYVFVFCRLYGFLENHLIMDFRSTEIVEHMQKSNLNSRSIGMKKANDSQYNRINKIN